MKAALIMALCLAGAASAWAGNYIVTLAEPPVAERYHTREAMQTQEAKEYRRHLQDEQARLRRELERLHITVTGSTQLLTNAIFIKAPEARIPEVRRLPGVKAVTPARRVRRM